MNPDSSVGIWCPEKGTRMLEQVLQHPVGVFFLIVALGSGLGKIRFANISLGASGVLFVGLLFGHYGYALPASFQNLE